MSVRKLLEEVRQLNRTIREQLGDAEYMKIHDASYKEGFRRSMEHLGPEGGARQMDDVPEALVKLLKLAAEAAEKVADLKEVSLREALTLRRMARAARRIARVAEQELDVVKPPEEKPEEEEELEKEKEKREPAVSEWRRRRLERLREMRRRLREEEELEKEKPEEEEELEKEKEKKEPETVSEILRFVRSMLSEIRSIARRAESRR
jgi:flagellar biosynthesis GTPase FlhF